MVLAALVELSAVAVRATVRGGDGETIPVRMHGERVAIGHLGRDEERLFVARVDEKELARAGVTARDGH